MDAQSVIRKLQRDTSRDSAYFYNVYRKLFSVVQKLLLVRSNYLIRLIYFIWSMDIYLIYHNYHYIISKDIIYVPCGSDDSPGSDIVESICSLITSAVQLSSSIALADFEIRIQNV